MQTARSNFAMIALKNYIYVYGGISGAGDGGRAHEPNISSIAIERYLIAGDSWDSVHVSAVPKLAAFSWCQMGDTS